MPTDPNEQTIKTLSGRWGPALALLYAAAALLLCVKAASIGSGALLNASLAVLLACTALCIGLLIGGRQAAIADGGRSDGFLPQAALLSAMDRHLAGDDPEGRAGALIHLDLTGTAAIAATDGLKAEDRLIREAWARLMVFLPATAISARAGRASFLIFLPGEADPFALAGLARSLTGNLAAGLTFWRGARHGLPRRHRAVPQGWVNARGVAAQRRAGACRRGRTGGAGLWLLRSATGRRHLAPA